MSDPGRRLDDVVDAGGGGGNGMARFRRVNTRIWNDEKFLALTDDSKLLFLCLLTHQDVGMLGAMRAYPVHLATNLGWDERRVLDALDELAEGSMVRRSANVPLIVMPNFLRYNPPENANQVRGCLSQLDDLPESEEHAILVAALAPFVRRFADQLVGDDDPGLVAEGLPQPLREPLTEGLREARTKGLCDVHGTLNGTITEPITTGGNEHIKRSSLVPSSGQLKSGTERKKQADSRRDRAEPITDDFAPNWRHKELAERLGVDVDACVEEMRDWALAKGERKVDWSAALRNWMRRAARQPSNQRSLLPISNGGGFQTAAEKSSSVGRRLLERAKGATR